MKAIINKIDLLFAVNATAKALGKNNINGDYSSIVIRADAGSEKVKLIASNGELTITANASAEIEEFGEIATNGKLFAKTVKRISQEEITLETSFNRLNLIYDGGSVELPNLPVDSKPLHADAADKKAFSISAGTLIEIVACTQTFSASDDTRRILRGINLKTDGDTLHAIGCDGFRLAKLTAQIENEAGSAINITVPVASAQVITSLIDKSNDRVEILLSEKGNILRVCNSVISITTALYVEDYLNPDNIIPKSFKGEVEVDKEALQQSIERAIVVSENTNKTVKLYYKQGKLEIVSESESGKLVDKITATTNGAEGAIAFNAKYLTDILKNHKGNKVKLQMNNSTSPAVIAESNATFLLLPLRITDM